MGGDYWQDAGSKEFIGARNEYDATHRDSHFDAEIPASDVMSVSFQK
jgi:hypothetical protein